MSSVILEAHDLTKEYRHTVALDHIDLKIEKGKIYGFIGQNGAGKTTFLRLVTGLAFPTSGTLSLWGKTVEKELQEQRKRIGCMIETPALFPTMTAYQNMEIQRIQRGIPDKAVIQKTLDMVGLKDTGKKAVRNFSLGMRQRLGIAIALLNTPEFLILDEPINGLDPAGIVEIRNLLKSLNKEYGMTILVSSHILEELYQTASEFILIDKGKIIEEISDRELNDRCKRHIAIKATDPQKALIVLEETLHTDSFKLMPDGMIRLYDYLDDMEKVAAALSDAHILVTGLSVAGDTLGGIRTVTKKYGYSNRSQLQRWIVAYQMYGDDGLKISQKTFNYSFEKKLTVVKLYLSSKLSYQEVSLQTGIINPNLISHWVCQYRSGGPDALRPKKKGLQKALDTNTPNGKILSRFEKEDTDTSIEHVKELEAELHELRIENAFLKELRRLRLEDEAKMRERRELSTVSEENSN